MVLVILKKYIFYSQSRVTENKPRTIRPRTAFLMLSAQSTKYKYLSAPKQILKGQTVGNIYNQ